MERICHLEDTALQLDYTGRIKKCKDTGPDMAGKGFFRTGGAQA